MIAQSDSISLAASDFVNTLCNFLTFKHMLHELIIVIFELLKDPTLSDQMKIAALEILVVAINDEEAAYFQRPSNVR